MSRGKTKRSPYGALTSTYAIALSVVALLLVGAYLFLDRAIEDQRKVALAVHMAKRQVALCQRVAWLTDRYATRGEAYARQQLQTMITEMASAAERLRDGHIDPQTTIDVPPEVRKIYADQYLDDRLRAFLTHARVIAFTDVSPSDGPQGRLLGEDMTAITVEADGRLQAALVSVGQEYERTSLNQIAQLEFQQRTALILILVTLVVEAFFIFRPLTDKVSDYVDEVLEHSRRASTARRAAQQASAAKSAFLSNMSHELRTPMTGIMGICDLLTSSDQPPEQANMTRMLRQSAQILLELLNDILDLAKIESGRMELETIDFDLAVLLTDVRNLFDPGMAEKGLAFHVEGAVEGEDVFRGDPKRIRQVLYNLIGNAMKFTEHGSVVVRYSREQTNADRAVLKFEVADSGVGISEEGQTRLFRKFEQEELSTSRRYGGTGLGLVICRELAQAMGGDIAASSTKGVGSTFTVRISLALGDAAAVKAEAAATPVQAGDVLKDLALNILVAEDNRVTQFILTRMLTMWGQNVIAVDDGGAALERASQERFDIILMDMQMPVMDGDDATRRIRAGRGPSADVPIIALTADGIAEHHQRYLQAGCNAVLTKPVLWTALSREIRAHLDMDTVTMREHAQPTQSASHAAVVEQVSSCAGVPEAPAKAAAPILNEEMVGYLREVLSPAECEEILQDALKAIRKYMVSLSDDIRTENLHQAQRDAHALKGLCGQIGADEVAAIALWIEEQSTDIAEVQDAMPRLEASISRVHIAILELAPGVI